MSGERVCGCGLQRWEEGDEGWHLEKSGEEWGECGRQGHDEGVGQARRGSLGGGRESNQWEALKKESRGY